MKQTQDSKLGKQSGEWEGDRRWREKKAMRKGQTFLAGEHVCTFDCLNQVQRGKDRPIKTSCALKSEDQTASQRR